MHEDIRLQADWLTQADERIMEFLLNSGQHPSSVIGHELEDYLGYSRPYIGQRCQELAAYGLLETHYNHYELSKKGEQYLECELDARKLTKDTK